MKRLLHLLLSLLLATATFGQQRDSVEQVEILFDLDSHAINSDDSNYRSNTWQLDDVVTRIKTLQSDSAVTIEKIEIGSYASPDGSARYNLKLAKARGASLGDYITERVDIDPNIIEIVGLGVDWQLLRGMVANSSMQMREQILSIIDSDEQATNNLSGDEKWLWEQDSRNRQLISLDSGRSYRYMVDNYFATLRYAALATIYYTVAIEPVALSRVAALEVRDNLSIANSSFGSAEQVLSTTMSQISSGASLSTAQSIFDSKPLNIALKSNLLFDAVTLSNIGLEVPINNKWSVAAEWIFPWWTWDDGTATSARNRIQLLNGNIEAKYWFGDRSSRPQLTGWYAGVYAGGGIYDFERDAKGYQGEFFIAAGIGCGYAHTINKSGSLRMEYSAGIGYLKTDYRYYEAQYDIDNLWHPIRRQEGNYTWIGPTRARVSLVWLFNLRNKRGDGR